MARRLIVLASAGALLVALLGVSMVNASKLPHPDKTSIVPSTSIGGVRLDMTEGKVLRLWGPAHCEHNPSGPSTPPSDVCRWGPLNGENAWVSFLGHGRSATSGIIYLQARTRNSDGRIVPGKLTKWRTGKGIHLGSKMAAVGIAYPGAKPNNSEAVRGFDIDKGARPNLRITEFSSGLGDSSLRVTGISLRWDVCHWPQYYSNVCP